MTALLRRLTLLLVLTAISAVTFVVAYSLRFGGPIPESHVAGMSVAALCAVGVKLFSFCWHRLDQNVNRYIGFYDLLTIAKATTWSTVGMTFVDAFLLPEVSIPRGVLLIDWGTTFLALGLLRSAPRAFRDLRASFGAEAVRRVLIVGANDEGETLLRTLRLGRKQSLRAIGFVDPDARQIGQRIGGVPVVGVPDDLERLVATFAAQEVLITGSLPGHVVRSLMGRAQSVGVPVRVLPTYEQLLRGSVSVGPRDVSIEDLLRRDPVRLDDGAISEWITGQTVLVTGSAGSIGSEICRQLLKHKPKKLVALDRSETAQFFLERELETLAPGVVDAVLADTNDRDRLDAVFAEHRPRIVFHAAAYKHVPLMEKHPGEAIKNIALATRNVADAAEAAGAESFVMVSTDKAVNPTSVMGACKQLAERYVQAKSVGSACRFVTVRFGNVLDSAGSVIPIFRQQIAQGGPITVTHPDINRYFMMIPEAAQLVIQAGTMGQGGEIFVLDMGEPVRILDLAKDMIRLSGLREGEDISVEITGLRPGEKLYEELYNDSEQHKPTSHEKIMTADCDTQPLVRVLNEISQLEDVVDGSPTEILGLLETIVPRTESEAPKLRVAA
ncbi:polysaccharide biosynthesis protein [Botrimarina mediterranea]|uniref:polysaccharide biosynthesis protein n=1 Tax=Botrimarina mediterranea TaxID=2528022 RepID=UPI001189493A|nr:UDP-N-acetyl-alpha-D-glucosamine C6 dehydratase [Planctomycetes bacterium K2D]